ncbi:MAG: phytanoyl-CoA dioxygenase family protein [Phycisphaeraceae bacterium]|nr:phytanoyl-CoA dioxygenase family protein [Phycisphaeraceae bacterium]
MTTSRYQPTDDELRQFRELGFFVTPVLFDSATLADMKQAIMALHAQAIREADRESPTKAERVRTRAFLTRCSHRSPLFMAFCRQEPFVELSRKMAGLDVDVCWSQAIVKPARTGRQLAWHQDAQYAITEPMDTGFTALVAITDSTVANGTVWALPGRHREGLLPHVLDASGEEWEGRYDDADKVPVEMKAGQALIFCRYLPHCSGPNTTDDVRITYQLGYVPPYIRLAATGQPFGDQVPLLRGGEKVSDTINP